MILLKDTVLADQLAKDGVVSANARAVLEVLLLRVNGLRELGLITFTR